MLVRNLAVSAMNRTDQLDVPAIQAELGDSGLNLLNVFSLKTIAESMPEFEALEHYSHLLLIGSAGTDLWANLPRKYLDDGDDPVDSYSIDCVQTCLNGHLSQSQWSMLYPELSANDAAAGFSVPLQKLGKLAGWHHPSPLGIGINGTHGLWFAYRVVVVIDANVPGAVEGNISSGSPCLSCEAKPCLSHCPAEALKADQPPDLNVCVTHRLAEDSSCASTCLARLACPVGLRFQYSEPQMAYFYDRSLASVRRWIDNNY